MIVGTLKNDLQLRDKTTLYSGSYVMIDFNKNNPQKCTMIVYDHEIKLPSISALKLIGKDQPSTKIQKKWALEGFAVSVGGYAIEADEWDCEDNPSWLLVSGIFR